MSCGGGGGGGVVVAPSPVPTPTSTVTPVTVVGLPVPTPTSTETVTVNTPGEPDTAIVPTNEYNSNYGLGNIKANAAYQRGVYGQGVTVGVVDSGALTSHEELSINLVSGRRAAGGSLYTDISDPHGHGTFVAGVIGGVRDGNRFHGVAPSVAIMPLQFFFTALPLNTLPLYHHAATAGVHIVNHSYGNHGSITGIYNEKTVVLSVPETELIISIQSLGGSYQGLFADIKTTMGSADMLMVWAVGNHGWHEGDGVTGNVRINPLQVITVSPSDIAQNFRSTSGVNFNTLSIDLNDPGGYALAPLYEPELTDRWLVVAAVDSLSVIWGDSNGCGNKSRYWCLAAPGVDIRSATNTDNTAVVVGDGTSFAAPHVSGALALIKSRLPSMPMRVARVVLLETATDLGAAGVDPVYGHGHLNVEAAMTAAGTFTVYGYGNLSAFSQSGVNLPSHYADFAARLADVSIAVRYLDKYHYDTRLGDFISLQEASDTHLGNAAQGVWGKSQQAVNWGGNLFALADESGNIQGAGFRADGFQFSYHLGDKYPQPIWESALDNVAKPFFAVGGKDVQARWQVGEWETFAVIGLDEDGRRDYHQAGFRWSPQIGGLHWLAEYSHVEENKTLLGGDLSVWGWQGGAATEQGRLGVQGNINDTWQGFAVYEHGFSDAHNARAGLIDNISAIETGAWRLGIQAKSLFRGNDVTGFAVSRKNAQDKGFISLRHRRAGETEFIEDLQQYLAVRADEVIDRVDISSKETHIFAWHYGFAPADGLRMSFGLEHETGQGETAASFVADWNL